jgi:hypothetical protein
MTWRRFLLAGLALASCHAEPRSASYFEAHPREAQEVVDACRTGAHRGSECETAQAGLAAVQADKRMQLFKKSFE